MSVFFKKKSTAKGGIVKLNFSCIPLCYFGRLPLALRCKVPFRKNFSAHKKE